MTAGGNSGTSDAMAANVAAASAEVIKLQDELTQARARLKELETADPASPLNAATNAANGLTGALAGASGQASALAQFLSRLPGALAGAASNIAGLRAGIATLSGGGDAAAASVAKYRAELEASLKDVLAATPFEEARLEVLAGIEQKVRLFEQEQKLSAEYQTQVAALAEVAGAASGAGAAGAAAGAAAAKGAEVAKHGWEAVTSTLADYAASARDIGADIGNSLVGAFQSAETAIGNFVRTGKLDFSDLITSMIADLAKLAARQFILGPIANVLSGALGNVGGIVAGVQHAGGTVGGAGPGRMVPAMAFAGAPRMHGGGFAGLRPDEVPAILQRGERVLSRREVTGSSAPIVNVTIMARDAASFRQSRTQVAADIARAVSLGRRGM